MRVRSRTHGRQPRLRCFELVDYLLHDGVLRVQNANRGQSLNRATSNDVPTVVSVR